MSDLIEIQAFNLQKSNDDVWANKDMSLKIQALEKKLSRESEEVNKIKKTQDDILNKIGLQQYEVTKGGEEGRLRFIEQTLQDIKDDKERIKRAQIALESRIEMNEASEMRGKQELERW